MPLYQYKAMNSTGRVMRGRMDAINLIDLEMRLKRMELDFINGETLKSGSALGSSRVQRRELINFCFHLEQLVRAGVPIVEGLGDLRDSLDNAHFRTVIAGLLESIEGGLTLSQGMEEHPRVFDEVFVNLTRAGEQSGRLPDVLNELGEALKWQDELAAQTKKLLLYPAFLGIVVVSVFLFMMLYLVPQLVGFMKNMGHELPLQTRILIATSDFLVHYWHAVLLVPLVSIVTISLAAQTRRDVRLRIDSAKLNLPVIGDIRRKIILSRFAGVFAMMYGAGIPILEAIRTCENVVGNSAVREGLQQAGRMISEGTQVTLAFQNVGLFPPLVVRMLRVGENSGALDTALMNVNYFYTRDVRESIERAQTMVEPVMTVIVGLILGWIMLSVLGPIYDTIATLKI